MTANVNRARVRTEYFRDGADGAIVDDNNAIAEAQHIAHDGRDFAVLVVGWDYDPDVAAAGCFRLGAHWLCYTRWLSVILMLRRLRWFACNVNDFQWLTSSVYRPRKLPGDCGRWWAIVSNLVRIFRLLSVGLTGASRRCLRHLALFAAIQSFFLSSAAASDLAFSMHVVAKDDHVSVGFRNTGSDRAPTVHVELELAGRRYDSGQIGELQPGQSKQADFRVAYPSEPGSYPLIARLYYENDGQTVSVLNVGYFNYQTRKSLPVERDLRDVILRYRTAVFLPRQKLHDAELIVPTGVEISERRSAEHGTLYFLKNSRPDLTLDSPYYAVYQTKAGETPRGTTIVSARIKTLRIVKHSSWLPAAAYPLIAVAALIITAALRCKLPEDEKLSLTQISLLRYTFSVSVVSFLYTIFHYAWMLPEYLLPHVLQWDLHESAAGRYLLLSMQTLLEWLYFDGGNYDYFAEYVAGPLYLYMLAGNYFVLRYLIRPQPSKDKYWHLMKSILSLGRRGPGERIFWSQLSKIAVLTLMVKAFYVPMLTSWTINNIVHQGNLTRGFRWEFFYIQSYVVAALILVDVTVFAFGYLVELPQLKNQIRSVEPTLLGWIVCIMCYPPFNYFAFIPFDRPLNEQWGPPNEVERYLAAGLIALLWGIYCWATIALGPKASNLTNRGIVDTGPYAYIRHPAYASKVALWAISSYFLGEKHFFLIATLVAVYALRAYTEERHLGQDPDYEDYCRKVRWRAIPGVF